MIILGCLAIVLLALGFRRKVAYRRARIQDADRQIRSGAVDHTVPLAVLQGAGSGKGDGTVQLIVGSVCVLILILGGAALPADQPNPAPTADPFAAELAEHARDVAELRDANAYANLHVGDCISAADFNRTNFNTYPEPCTSPTSPFEVASIAVGASATCPDGKSAAETHYPFLSVEPSTPSTRLVCLAFNLHEGECYSVADVDAGMVLLPNCVPTSPNQKYSRVLSRTDGSTDSSLCIGYDDSYRVIVSPVPARVLCIQHLR